MRFETPGETSQAFGKNGELNPPDEFMSVVDIENQNPGRIGPAFLLRAVGHAEVEIPFRSGLTGDEGGDREENHNEQS